MRAAGGGSERQMYNSYLTRFEVARLVGLRALQLSEGHAAAVEVADETMRTDFKYVAAMELRAGRLDAKVVRHGAPVHVSELHLPDEIANYVCARENT